MTVDSRLHHTIPGQLSSSINEEFPLFVDFLSAYYEWLETEGSPYYHLKDHLSYLDFTKSLDEYTNLLKNEYLNSIPKSVLANKELLVKYSKQFYQNLGTEQSFKFLFKILFDEEVTLYYPKNDILRASDGNWVDDETVIYVSNYGDVDSLLYRRIEQKYQTSEDVYITVATATVNKISHRYANRFDFVELSLTDIQGELDINLPIGIGDIKEWILPITSDEVTITSGGLNYLNGNVLEYNGSPTFDISIMAIDVGMIDCRYTTLIDASELVVKVNGSPISNFFYDGKFLFHVSIIPGAIVTFTYNVYHGYVIVEHVNDFGTIDIVNILDTPIGIVSPQPLLTSDGGSGANILLNPSLSRKKPGYFVDSSGFLSSEKKLQDSDYYQDYSYVIRAGISVEKYRDIVMNVIHPAGLKMIGEVNIVELIKLFMRDISMVISIKLVGELNSSVDYNLYNKNVFVDDWKYKLSSNSYSVGHFKDVVVGDIIEDLPFEKNNIHDGSVAIEDFYFVDQDDYILPVFPYLEYVDATRYELQ